MIQNCLPPPEQWEDIESDYDHVLNVLGIISLDEEVPSFVGLYRTTDLGELSQVFVGVDTVWWDDDYYYIDSLYEPAALIKDAIVQISDGQNVFEFSFVETEIFYDTVNFTIGGIDYQFIDTLDIPINYYKDTLGIFEPQSGVNYSLTIQASGYDPVTGSLKTPIYPELNDGLIPDTIVSRSTFEIHWDSWEDTTKGFLSGSVVEEDKDSWEEGKNWCRSYFERVVNLSLSVSKPGALRGSKEVGLTIFRSR